MLIIKTDIKYLNHILIIALYNLFILATTREITIIIYRREIISYISGQDYRLHVTIALLLTMIHLALHLAMLKNFSSIN